MPREDFEAIDWWLVDESRDSQLPPPAPWLYWMVTSGRGFGKTHLGARWITHKARSMPGSKGGLVGETATDVRNIMIEQGPSALLNVSDPWFMPQYYPAKKQLVWPNGSTATLYSGDKPGQLRGPQFHWLWADELAKYIYAQEVYEQLEFTMRLTYTTEDGRHIEPQVLLTTTPRPIKCIKELASDPDCIVTSGSTFENKANLSQARIKRLRRKYEGTALGKQEISGEILQDTKGALWRLGDSETPGTIEYHRCTADDVPELVRVVVGVDPPGATAECGIVAAGMDENGIAYVLEDASIEGDPTAWAEATYHAYTRTRAGIIVAERNQGGAMVTTTLQAVELDGRKVGKNLPIEAVWASRGKRTRAEPHSVFYRNGRVRHVGNAFSELEDQMTTWIPGMESPDRMDALVWALTWLFNDEIEDNEPGTGIQVKGNK
jgi:phage terminase large subunit-like protein